MNAPEKQTQQSEWLYQWNHFKDDERFLFLDWISPFTLESFRDKDVLECGCGSGQHTSFMAPYARRITAVDLNTAPVAREKNKSQTNIEYREEDIAAMDLQKQFDIVISIGVVHHTDDPDKTVANMTRHLKPGGQLLLWVYSKEGNALVNYGLEPIRKLFLTKLPRPALAFLSTVVTALLYIPVYTLYLLPLSFLPYYAYFRNFRRLSFARNRLNVFDKLNAPQVRLISRAQAGSWFPAERFEDVRISSYCGVSWRASGRLKK